MRALFNPPCNRVHSHLISCTDNQRIAVHIVRDIFKSTSNNEVTVFNNFGSNSFMNKLRLHKILQIQPLDTSRNIHYREIYKFSVVPNKRTYSSFMLSCFKLYMNLYKKRKTISLTSMYETCWLLVFILRFKYLSLNQFYRLCIT